VGCRIDAAIHKSLAIEAGDTDLALVLGEAERLRPQGRDVFAQRYAAGGRQARGPRAGSSKQQ
jgi:hypothetical protein